MKNKLLCIYSLLRLALIVSSRKLRLYIRTYQIYCSFCFIFKRNIYENKRHFNTL